ITDKPLRDSLFRGHFSNMGVMAAAGKLVVAGPLGQNDRTYRGIFILNVRTLDEAKQLTKTDPAIKAGIFDVELFPWYGSAALPMYLPYTEKVEMKKIQ
ncbi:MAG TPA: YciI family protein, partial [Phnomibacter sp.]|nr:YciI family protein [Phnomibacter sp.]